MLSKWDWRDSFIILKIFHYFKMSSVDLPRRDLQKLDLIEKFHFHSHPFWVKLSQLKYNNIMIRMRSSWVLSLRKCWNNPCFSDASKFKFPRSAAENLIKPFSALFYATYSDYSGFCRFKILECQNIYFQEADLRLPIQFICR